MVPKEGLEPSWYRYRQILSLVRLPFRHFGKFRDNILHFFVFSSPVSIHHPEKHSSN